MFLGTVDVSARQEGLRRAAFAFDEPLARWLLVQHPDLSKILPKFLALFLFRALYQEPALAKKMASLLWEHMDPQARHRFYKKNKNNPDITQSPCWIDLAQDAVSAQQRAVLSQNTQASASVSKNAPRRKI